MAANAKVGTMLIRYMAWLRKSLDWPAKGILLSWQVVCNPKHLNLQLLVFCSYSDLPYAYTSCELAIKDAQILNAHWQFAGVGTLRYIIDHIENFPCLGVKDKDDRLVAWELSYFTGAMGMLYVMEEHRGKGLAKFIICKLARKLLQLGRNVYCFVEDTNEISLNLHKKCGFSIQEGHSGYFAKLLNDV